MPTFRVTRALVFICLFAGASSTAARSEATPLPDVPKNANVVPGGILTQKTSASPTPRASATPQASQAKGFFLYCQGAFDSAYKEGMTSNPKTTQLAFYWSVTSAYKQIPNIHSCAFARRTGRGREVQFSYNGMGAGRFCANQLPERYANLPVGELLRIRVIATKSCFRATGEAYNVTAVCKNDGLYACQYFTINPAFPIKDEPPCDQSSCCGYFSGCAGGG